MQDRPTDRELLEVVAQFMGDELEPLVRDNPRVRFRLLIAINLLKIVGRELAQDDAVSRDEWQRLVRLTDGPATEPPTQTAQLYSAITAMTQDLCTRIRAGEADAGLWRADLLNHLEQTTIEKLQIANPRLLAEKF